MAMDNVLRAIREKQAAPGFDSSARKFVFLSGEKDFMVSQRVDKEDIFEHYKGYMTEENTLVVNLDKDLKNYYSSLHHNSLFYSKYFYDTFVVFLAKAMLGDDPMRLARDHLFLNHHVPVLANQTGEECK
jgi:hypothetical protein